MKYLEIIPDFLSMYGVFTTQNTSQIRQEMSTSKYNDNVTSHTCTCFLLNPLVISNGDIQT